MCLANGPSKNQNPRGKYYNLFNPWMVAGMQKWLRKHHTVYSTNWFDVSWSWTIIYSVNIYDMDFCTWFFILLTDKQFIMKKGTVKFFLTSEHKCDNCGGTKNDAHNLQMEAARCQWQADFKYGHDLYEVLPTYTLKQGHSLSTPRKCQLLSDCLKSAFFSVCVLGKLQLPKVW